MLLILLLVLSFFWQISASCRSKQSYLYYGTVGLINGN